MTLAEFYQRVDSALARAREPLFCDTGCSYCCHYHVLLYPAEVFALADFVATLPVSMQATVNARLVANVETVCRMTEAEHIATNIRCALLDDRGRCLAYGTRPLACRQHHSLDGVSCKVTFDDPSSPMQNLLSGQRMAIASGAFQALVAAAQTGGCDATRYEMNAALREALTNPACRNRWRSGKAAFTPLTSLTTSSVP